MRMKHRPNHRSPDEGFTLIEVLLTVTILGVISAGLFGVVFQYLNVAGVTRTRLSESTDQQFISTYWQNDVSSLGRRAFNPTDANPVPTMQSVYVGGAGPSGCGNGVGAVVVAFAWQEYAVDSTPANAWTSTPQEVAYVLVGDAAPFLLRRVRCVNGVAEPPLTVAHKVNGTPQITCDTTCTSATLPNRVSMSFTIRDVSESDSAGYTTTVSADRRQS